MRRKYKNQPTFDPDDLSYYVWDHLNTDVRLRRLGLAYSSRETKRSYPNRIYRLDVPLARGYGDGKSKRPVSTCRIHVHDSPSGARSGVGYTLIAEFHFGWLRRTSSVYKIRHHLVPPATNGGAYHAEFEIREHEHVNDFESNMAKLIKTLHEHNFDDLEFLFEFMQHWVHVRYEDDRTSHSLLLTKKLRRKDEPTGIFEPVKTERPHKYRMGRVHVPSFSRR
jgi:hypothetical protein